MSPCIEFGVSRRYGFSVKDHEQRDMSVGSYLRWLALDRPQTRAKT